MSSVSGPEVFGSNLDIDCKFSYFSANFNAPGLTRSDKEAFLANHITFVKNTLDMCMTTRLRIESFTNSIFNTIDISHRNKPFIVEKNIGDHPFWMWFLDKSEFKCNYNNFAWHHFLKAKPGSAIYTNSYLNPILDPRLSDDYIYLHDIKFTINTVINPIMIYDLPFLLVPGFI